MSVRMCGIICGIRIFGEKLLSSLVPDIGVARFFVYNRSLFFAHFRQAVCDTMNRHMMLHYGLEAPVFGKVSKSVRV